MEWNEIIELLNKVKNSIHEYPEGFIVAVISSLVAAIIYGIFVRGGSKNSEINISDNDSTNIITHANTIEVSENSLVIDDKKYFLTKITGTSLKEDDVRTDRQKAYDFDTTATIFFGCLAAVLLTVIFLVYLGIEYVLGLIGIEGIIANNNHGDTFDSAIGFLIIFIIICVATFIYHMIMHKYEEKILEWTLCLDIDDGSKLNIVTITDNIKNLKKHIDNNIVSKEKSHKISYVLNRKTLIDQKIDSAIKWNETSYDYPIPENDITTQDNDFGSDQRWSINSDGTVTDYINGLTWIQAPWGMVFKENGFVGDPIELSWEDATLMFGRGKFIDSEGGYLDETGYQKSQFVNGYKRGSVVINHAGQVDWRLPTADEFRTIQFGSNVLYPDLDFEISNQITTTLFPYTKLGQQLWSATGKQLFSKYQHIDAHQLEGIKKLFVMILGFIESKTLGKDECNAWRFNFKGPLDVHSKIKYPILFVRNS